MAREKRLRWPISLKDGSEAGRPFYSGLTTGCGEGTTPHIVPFSLGKGQKEPSWHPVCLPSPAAPNEATFFSGCKKTFIAVLSNVWLPAENKQGRPP